MKFNLFFKLVMVLMLFLAVGCGDAGDSETTTSDDGGRGTGSRPSKPRYDGPDPEPGTSNVYGEILWNGEGAAGLDLVLCQDFSSFSGCGGAEYDAQTETNGTYLFANVDPGTYALSVRVFDTDNWLYISGGILSSYDFVAEADETLIIDTQNIFKLDLQIASPKNLAKVEAGDLTLSWETYEGADYYQIYFTPDEGEAILVNERVDGTDIAVDLLPVDCEYRWQVEAFNADGVKIAETEDSYDFEVTGNNASCHLQLNEPVDNSTVSGSGVVLRWEEHPMAANYKVWLRDGDNSDADAILDFESILETSYTVEQTLAPARYIWSVTAIDEAGNDIAGSEIFDFTVAP